jgi:hypothetical protein
MRRPLLYSAGIHAAVLIATMVALPSPKELPPVPMRVLPVELLKVGDITNLKRQAKKKVEEPKPVEKPSPKPEPDKPKPQPQPEPEKTEPQPSPEQPEKKPEPIPEKKAEKKPEEKKEPPKPESKKPIVEKKTKEKPKKSFNPKDIAALLNKIPDTATQPDESKDVKEKADADQTDNPDLPMTGSEIDVVRQKVSQCWNTGDIAGTPDANKLYARVTFSLNRDGSLAGRPVVEESGGGSLARLFAERTVQAIQKCVPYDFLPAEKYNTWRDMDIRFSLPDAL